jgi:type VI secretion system secreted protein VgrG
MPSSLEQSTRLGELTTPLGKDVLALSRFDGSEGLSELFEFRIEASSLKEDLPLRDIIGQSVSVRVTTIGGGEQYFTGIATEAQWLGVQDQLFSYRIIVRPWLFLLSHRVNSRIFNQSSVSDIIAKVFNEHGFEFEDKADHTQVLEYCVQYQESDLAFVQRLMEQHGITYHFEFSADSHKLILGGKQSFTPIAGGSREFVPQEHQHSRKAERFSTLVPERQFTSGKVALHDYDFEHASAKIDTDATASTDFTHGDFERYDATGRYVEQDDGDKYAKIQMDSLRAVDGRYHASGDVLSAHAGNLVTIEKHPTASLNKQYLIVRCYHSVVAETYRSGGGVGKGDSGYSGSYELLDAEVNFVPPLITPCPIIAGPQTAVVTGRGDIDCDEYGRILVSFHWEREGEKSMRCRVAQVWAGRGWGGIFIPRVGMEVLVQFLDGNPDRPVVIGTVYNLSLIHI